MSASCFCTLRCGIGPFSCSVAVQSRFCALWHGSVPFLHPVVRRQPIFAPRSATSPVFAPCGAASTHSVSLARFCTPWCIVSPFLHPAAQHRPVFAPRGTASARFCTPRHDIGSFFHPAARHRPVFAPRGATSARFCTPRHSSGSFLHCVVWRPLFTPRSHGASASGCVCMYAHTGQPVPRPRGQQLAAHYPAAVHRLGTPGLQDLQVLPSSMML